MELSLEIVDYVVIGIMLAISASIGIYFRFTGGRQKTTREFLMAGKDMPILPVAFSLMATYMSTNSLLGIPSEIYMYGTQIAIWLVGFPVGAIIAAYMFVPIFFDIDASTAYEYLEKRFGKLTRSIISMLFMVQTILYMSIVLYGPALALNAVTGLSTWTSVITLGVVCTFYCSLGGLKAVLWTDVFQAILMYITLIAVVAKAAIDVGGMQTAFERAYDGGRLIIAELSFDMTVRYTFWNTILNGIFFSVSTFGANQSQIQRMMSVRSLKRAQWSLFTSIPLVVVYTSLCFWAGVMIYSLFYDCDPILDPSNHVVIAQDQFIPYAVLIMFRKYPGLSGLCVSGIFAASLSTISSAVNSLTAVTMEDFIKPYCTCKKLTDSWAAFIAKIVAVFYGAICLMLTAIVSNFQGVMEASHVLLGMLSGPALGVFLLGMFTTTANEEGTLFGLLVGLILNTWLGIGSFSAKVKVPALPRSIDGCSTVSNLTTDVFFNNSIEITTASLINDDIDDDNKDAFILYKLSFLWIKIVGLLIVLISGYLFSFAVGFFIEREPVQKALISPAVRKLHFRTSGAIKEELHMEKKEQPSDTIS